MLAYGLPHHRNCLVNQKRTHDTAQHSAAQHGAARRGMANTHAPNNAQIREIGWGGTVLLWSSSQMFTKE